MKSAFSLFAMLMLLPAVFAVQVGDTLEQVVAEKGAPKSKAQVGAALIISYFMHLRYDRPSLGWTLMPALVFVILMMFVFFADSLRLLLLQ